MKAYIVALDKQHKTTMTQRCMAERITCWIEDHLSKTSKESFDSDLFEHWPLAMPTW